LASLILHLTFLVHFLRCMPTFKCLYFQFLYFLLQGGF
jgi:hypothetical protein